MLFRSRGRSPSEQVDERRTAHVRYRLGQLEANAARIVMLAQHLAEAVERQGAEDRVGEVHGEGGAVELARPPRQVLPRTASDRPDPASEGGSYFRPMTSWGSN